jgi:hypothetical protein
MLEVVGSPFIGVLSLSDYDIAAGGLVWTVVFRGAVRAASAPASSAFGQLGGNGVPAAVGGTGLLPNDVRPVPVVGIGGGQFRGQSITFFRSARPTPDTLHKFGVPVAQTRRVGRSQCLPQRGIIIG